VEKSPWAGLVEKPKVPEIQKEILVGGKMKTYCKNVDPTDIKTIEPFVWSALNGKLKRRDYSGFVAEYCEFSAEQIRKMAREHTFCDGKAGAHKLENAIKAICLDIIERIKNRSLDLPPVHYHERVDGMNGKVRKIGIEPIIQQVIEHVADGCLSELWKKKFCYYQFASIKGKGQLKGAKAIQKWTTEAIEKPAFGKSTKYAKYFVKVDIKQCYASIKKEVVMDLLRRDIGKNKVLLWLVDAILDHHGDGLIIGSPLSKSLCNYLLSYGYRYVMGLGKVRRGKRIRLVSHALFWMDDILLMGPDRRNILMAARKLNCYLSAKFGLAIKPNWHVKNHDLEPIDMMGFVVYGNGKFKIRKKIFIRARRAFVKTARQKEITVKAAMRGSAYYGYFKHCHIKSCIFLADGTKIDIEMLKKQMSKVISDKTKEEKLC
jgi:hypothetical protein